MIRAALAAIVFCFTLSAAVGQMLPQPAGAGEFPQSATIAHAPLGGAPAEDEREWRPRHDTKASITESAWKWRTLHAGLAATVGPGSIVAVPVAERLPARAAAAPFYLLHIPLLI